MASRLTEAGYNYEKDIRTGCAIGRIGCSRSGCGHCEIQQLYIKMQCLEDLIDRKKTAPYAVIKDLYNQICVSLPKVTKISEVRKKSIKARLNEGYSIDDFKRLFEIVEATPFLKGDNSRGWHASFDWLVNGNNMPKVLEGVYADNRSQSSFDIDAYAQLAVNFTSSD